jgi:hypothetical protein
MSAEILTPAGAYDILAAPVTGWRANGSPGSTVHFLGGRAQRMSGGIVRFQWVDAWIILTALIAVLFVLLAVYFA